MEWVALIIGTCLLLVLALTLYNRNKFISAEITYPPTGKFIEVEGIRVHYIEKGSGQPVVLLHGGILSADDFEKVMEMASNRGFHAYAFDRIGNGYSERPVGEITLTVHAKYIHQALKILGVNNPIFVGHSWSGALVMAYALEYPTDISGAILLSAGLYGGEAYPGTNDPIIRLLRIPLLSTVLLQTLLVPIGRLFARRMLKSTFAPDPVPVEYTRRTIALWLRPLQFKSNREDIAAFSTGVELISRRYSMVEIPIAIAVGEFDPFLPNENSYRLHNELANSTLTVVLQAGHMLPQVHPDKVVDILENFYTQHYARTELE